jgi:hypothetical protein
MAKTADPRLQEVFTLGMAEKAGLTRQQASRRVRSGQWRRLGSGVYCLTSTWDRADRRGRHLLEAEAACLRGAEDRCISHASAAAWHGFPLPFGETPVWLTGPPGTATDARRGINLQAATVTEADYEIRDAVRVTTVPRTVADCLRHLDLGDAVAIGDAALRREPKLVTQVEQVLDRCAGWPYVQRARLRLPLLDGRRESALESVSFTEMHSGGVVLPDMQVRIYDEQGRFVGRGDFWWEGTAVLGEADGLVKYGVGEDDDLAKSRRALVEEKRREDRLRRLGIHVVRWGLAELRDPGWVDWLKREIASGDPRGFRGRAVPTRWP